jgi:hypothetical protein
MTIKGSNQDVERPEQDSVKPNHRQQEKLVGPSIEQDSHESSDISLNDAILNGPIQIPDYSGFEKSPFQLDDEAINEELKKYWRKPGPDNSPEGT